MASIYNSRKFNLVPPITKEEEIEIKERDNSFFYSFILIFCAIIVFFFLTLAQSLVIEPKVTSTKESVDNLNTQISTYNNLKKVHGELYIKSQSLDSILLQDIKLTQLLDISEEITKGISNSQVIVYSRESTGQFVLDLELSDFADVDRIFDNSKQVKVLKGINLRNVERQEDHITARIGFYITNIINQDDQQ